MICAFSEMFLEYDFLFRRHYNTHLENTKADLNVINNSAYRNRRKCTRNLININVHFLSEVLTL